MNSLYKLVDHVKALGYPVILDAKRADIGNTSKAYAREVFDFWGADAVTISPYMGSDSVMPFIDMAIEKGRGIYILTRTSNTGAQDLQELRLKDGKKVYMRVAEKVVEWGKKAGGNVGAVVGATSPDELEEVSIYFSGTGQLVPLLIPGVGRQGGEAWQITERLVKTRNPMAAHRINISRDLIYAYEKLKMPPEKFAEAAVKALRSYNQEILDTMAKYGITAW